MRINLILVTLILSFSQPLFATKSGDCKQHLTSEVPGFKKEWTSSQKVSLKGMDWHPSYPLFLTLKMDNSPNRSIQVWDSKTSQLVKSFEVPTGGSSYLDAFSAKWSPDGKMIAVLANGSLIVWDFESEAMLYKHGIDFTKSGLHWSPNSSMILTVGSSQNIEIIDVKTGKHMRDERYEPGLQLVGVPKWSHDSKKILTDYSDFVSRIWNIFDGKYSHRRSAEKYGFELQESHWLSNDRVLIVNSSKAKIWDPNNVRTQQLLPGGDGFPPYFRKAKANPKGDKVAFVKAAEGEIDEVFIYDVVTRKRTKVKFMEIYGKYFSNFFSPKYKPFSSHPLALDVFWNRQGDILTVTFADNIFNWDVNSGSFITSDQPLEHEDSSLIDIVDWSADSQSFLSYGDQKLILWTNRK